MDLDLYLFKIFDFLKTFYMNLRQIYFDIVWQPVKVALSVVAILVTVFLQSCKNKDLVN